MIKAREFIKALDQLEKDKGIAKETIILALKEAMEKGFIKQLGVTDDMEEARVRVDIDAKKATIAMYQIKRVVEEVFDDFVEISVEDANENGGNYKVGDDYEIEASTDDLTKLTAQNIKSVLKQKLAECEKQAVFEAYVDKKDEMITGIIEKTDDRNTIINIGRTSVYLPKSQRIRNETFKVGQTVKLYVVDVTTTTKGPQIIVSRTEPGFLKRLFEEYVSEVREGTVIIKDVAREAGDRSKVAVYSLDKDIEAVGACIGNNGSRVQAISSELGDTKEKEKVDIISYHENPALYIAEALKPATVVGVAINAAEKKAVAVVKNEQLSLAIGKKGVNARLAVKLTGWNIDIKEIDDALACGVVYKSIEQIQSEEEFSKYNKVKVEEIYNDVEEYEEEFVEEVEEETVTETVVEDVVEEQPVNEEPVVETKVEEVKPEKVETPVVKEEPKVVSVKETKKLADLEKELEEEKKRRDRQQAYANRKRTYKKNDSTEDEFVEEKEEKKVVDKSTYMSIYTEEELRQMEEEDLEEEYYEDDVDYDEYDSYYDDEN